MPCDKRYASEFSKKYGLCLASIFYLCGASFFMKAIKILWLQVFKRFQKIALIFNFFSHSKRFQGFVYYIFGNMVNVVAHGF